MSSTAGGKEVTFEPYSFFFRFSHPPLFVFVFSFPPYDPSSAAGERALTCLSVKKYIITYYISLFRFNFFSTFPPLMGSNAQEIHSFSFLCVYVSTFLPQKGPPARARTPSSRVEEKRRELCKNIISYHKCISFLSLGPKIEEPKTLGKCAILAN